MRAKEGAKEGVIQDIAAPESMRAVRKWPSMLVVTKTGGWSSGTRVPATMEKEPRGPGVRGYGEQESTGAGAWVTTKEAAGVKEK